MEGDRGIPGSAALKRVGLCLLPVGLHGVLVQHRGHCCPFLGALGLEGAESLQQSAQWFLALELRPCHIPPGPESRFCQEAAFHARGCLR